MLAFEWRFSISAIMAYTYYHTIEVSTLQSIRFPALRSNYQIWSLNLALHGEIHQDIVHMFLFRSTELYST